ncbi:hypothetical protein GE21DRAFT_1033702 [Neurospora crassa]|nr:hypothetical protein GE21DRAFT_1033702 [Neurospora crassa]
MEWVATTLLEGSTRPGAAILRSGKKKKLEKTKTTEIPKVKKGRKGKSESPTSEKWRQLSLTRVGFEPTPFRTTDISD